MNAIWAAKTQPSNGKKKPHVYFPEIAATKQTSGLRIGKGQNLYIEKMPLDGSENISFKGEATNQKTGEAEPLRLDFIREVKSTIKDLGTEPVVFCKTVVTEASRLTKDIYRVV